MGLQQPKVDMSVSLRTWAQSGVVHEVRGIKRAFVEEPKTGGVAIKTEGANIPAMFQYSKILDLNRLHCNDIYKMHKQYGVEAASQVIVKASRLKFNGIIDIYFNSL